ncbi:uncharacterized protein LOC101747003 [Bombyx mori]|uniref:BTB domain-containing protein n=1 Tax=Bombyx mori TaxID=7091 RepID=A0A8R2AR90_BOMMO|nr:uncharacterized protein LOC101747003 [Bombyx mori]
MAPVRYSLHYEDYSEHMMSRFGKLLQMQSLVDMTLMCSSHTLRVHKAVLAASSTYFQEVLQKQPGEPLIILKMRFNVLKCLVEFMYCGKTQCLEENLDELVSAAQFLKIKGLSKVTKEGLGIANNSELPVFMPPVVINRPPQSLVDLHSQVPSKENEASHSTPQMTSVNSNSAPHGLERNNRDMVVRIPFDIENGGSSMIDYPNAPRVIKPRRGRPSMRRSGWDGPAPLGRAAERALLRREQDSRKAIHHLKHLQTRHMQDYMDKVTLSQAVNSICGIDAPNYMENDVMYADPNVSANIMDSASTYCKDNSESAASSYNNGKITSPSNTATTKMNTAMSQYVNALKNAGLPTDLPILFESGDGSYINVNEQVLLDMVQSSEIQYEVIEQPNIIEKVADPSEIKSIDDLSKSIERGEMILGQKNFSTMNNYDKGPGQFAHQDALNSLNEILPDTFGEQESYVVLDSRLQENNNTMESMGAADFSCIDGDMQYFTKSLGDDIKKYYEDQQLNETPASAGLATSFNMSLLDTKISHLNENLNQSYNSLTVEDLRRNDEYDFGLQLPQNSEFKDEIDCLMSTPKHNAESCFENERANQERDEIIKDLMNLEKNVHKNKMETDNKTNIIDEQITSGRSNIQDFGINMFDDSDATSEANHDVNRSENPWDSIDKDSNNDHNHFSAEVSRDQIKKQFPEPLRDLTDNIDAKADQSIENLLHESSDVGSADPELSNIDTNGEGNEIPFAVGLQPLKQSTSANDNSLLKRKSSEDFDNSHSDDTKYLKCKSKSKKL